MTIGKRLDFLMGAQADRISTVSVTLDGKNYFVQAQLRRWDASWMISMATAAGVAVIDGARANVDEDLLAGIVVPDRPPGQLLVRDTSGRSRSPASAADWRSGCELVYVPLGA